MDWKWKLLIVSIVLYQALLTWCMFSLVNVASYLARPNCGDWCVDRTFGFILTNQGALDTARMFIGASIVIALVNVIAWIISIVQRGKA